MKTTWKKKLIEWTEGTTAYLSVVFSWHLPIAYQKAAWYKALGYTVKAGGPAVLLNPSYLAGVTEIGEQIPALHRHNPDATFTSRGCPRRCPFCAVPTIEGQIRELTNWQPKPIVCDNNLLACSKTHFDKVIDRLKPLAKIDFNQGLDAQLLTQHHAERLAELDLKAIRLAWDHISAELEFMAAYEKVRKAGIAKRKIRAYVLIGYNDTPEDAQYRLQTIKDLGITPNPMRYQPLDALVKNSYVAPGWTRSLLTAFMRYWSHLRNYGPIPFKDFLAKALSSHPRPRRAD